MQRNLLIILSALIPLFLSAQEKPKVFPGADENTPSRAQYFSWINNTNEGTTAGQTLKNLDFFRWLNEEYGMKLDIYAFDAGALDGRGFYGSMNSERFKRQFPDGLGPLSKKAAQMGTRLGIWGGPDGFGNTPEEERSRIETMVSLCRDYNFELFKFDAVCGQLRPEKYDAFDRMMTECRKYSPNLILLNHRLDLGKGIVHSTTFLLGGAETYIDVHMANSVTAPHHRAGALSRELPPKLTRLTEDHGVCISSCLDYWEDDLILQAFNRNLILAPEIYGNPWLLRDDEYPLLARIFNLTRKYGSILVNGMVLPEKEYGPNAVSRGDDKTRFLTLRNLTWEPVNYSLTLDESVGLTNKGIVEVRSYHPTEKLLGKYPYGIKAEVEVLPFRSALIRVSTDDSAGELALEGTDYGIVNGKEGKPVVIDLLGMPGTEAKFILKGAGSDFRSATLDGLSVPGLLKGKIITVKFEGEELKLPYHRKLGTMTKCEIPRDAEAIYEATCFSADNNALEVRELKRSGETKIAQVADARNAFFGQDIFRKREIWDIYMFDGDPSTAFSVNVRWSGYEPGKAALRLDMGKPTGLDSIVVTTFDEFSLQPLKSEEGEYALVSVDLKEWKSILFYAGLSMKIDLSGSEPIRFLKMQPAPLRISEITGYKNGKPVSRNDWRASNLFMPYIRSHWDRSQVFSAQNAWSSVVKLDQIPKGSYLCIAVNGEHGAEGAFAGARIDGKYLGAPDRAPSYRSNSWEVGVRTASRNYTYYIPLTKEMEGKNIEVFVLGFNRNLTEIRPEVWVTAYPAPYVKKRLVIERKEK